jgi:hypothetical protein
MAGPRDAGADSAGGVTKGQVVAKRRATEDTDRQFIFFHAGISYQPVAARDYSGLRGRAHLSKPD